jgi:hypothetical protein
MQQDIIWGDSGEIQCRSNFLFNHGIRVVRGGPPRLPKSRIGWPLRKDYIAPNFYEIQDAH